MGNQQMAKDRESDILETVALGIINGTREHHGLDPIKWDFPALSSENKRGAMRQASSAIAALNAAGYFVVTEEEIDGG